MVDFVRACHRECINVYVDSLRLLSDPVPPFPSLSLKSSSPSSLLLPIASPFLRFSNRTTSVLKFCFLEPPRYRPSRLVGSSPAREFSLSRAQKESRPRRPFQLNPASDPPYWNGSCRLFFTESSYSYLSENSP